MRKLLDKLFQRNCDVMDGVERDLTLLELETLLDIVRELDLHCSYMEQRFNEPTAQVFIGVHNNESKIGVLSGLDTMTAAALVMVLDELIPIIKQAMQCSKS